MPNALDPAIRRRFDKRIYIALPDSPARAKMFKIHLGDTPHKLAEEDFRFLGNNTDGFSGSDINLIVKDTLMQPVRKVQEATHFRYAAFPTRVVVVHGVVHIRLASQSKSNTVSCRPATGPDGASGYWEPCAPSAPGAQEKDLTWFATNDQADKVLVPCITRADFEASLHRARPTVSPDDLSLYEKFTSEFGEEGV